ncbi:hypothetical protein SAMN04487783_1662 [Agrococcus baldri]|uniref:Uncharacterized protein n=1 Tax=Agrococcus baldri TaxID=153730 RepID=A0AA94KZQ0_9MICO|nr:hypothetical protein [Agrococcus baldri]SFS12034.1 hypothetical protein SAMN04487783_1662 [Agrococcus baldri]
MDGHDEEARRWAPPGHPAARDGGGEPQPEQQPTSAAAPWTRGLGPARRPRDASVTPPSEIEAPELPWVAPLESAADGQREKSMLPLAIGVALLALLACVPHWVAPTIALMVALVGVPIAWGFRRISQGRRRVQYIVVVLSLLLIAALSVIAPLTWLELGVLQPLTVPDVPAPE